MHFWKSKDSRFDDEPLTQVDELKDDEISQLLRLAAVRPETPEHSRFEKRVVRKWIVASGRRNIAYLMPIIFGGVTAAMAIIAVMQIVATKPEAEAKTISPYSEARLRERPISFQPVSPPLDSR